MSASGSLTAELVALLRDARARTLALLSDLADEQMSVPRLEHVNPPLWEMGHVAFFWEAFVLRELDGAASGVDDGDQLYDSFRVEHPTRWDLPLPSRRATLDYMQRVSERAIARLAGRSAGAREAYLYRLAALHEDMHGEALAYTRQTLGYAEPRTNGGGPVPGGGPCPGDVTVPGGVFLLGAAGDAPFTFDNEKPAHEVELEPFRIARAPVTNAEFAAFVEDQGYLRRELWSEPGWRWRTGERLEHPLYWRRAADDWRRVHFARELPLEEHQPVVHVSWFEAEAWCRWAGRRLPSEAEWEAAASAEPDPHGGVRSSGDGAKRRFPWGAEPPVPARANLDGRTSGCVDVGAYPAGDSACGCRQMLGNVWEWTASEFLPYPGFVADAPYREYSEPWFGGRRVLRGGAWATRARLACNTYRNFFPPHRNDVFAGFRTCARS